MNRRTKHERDDSTACQHALRSGERVLAAHEEPPLGAHLVTGRALYTHHGIYVGAGRVVHYGGFAAGLRRRPVEDVSLEQFGRSRGIRIRGGAAHFGREQVVERARSRLGESDYRLLTNNCEHFSEWCLRGRSCSHQVEALRTALPRVLAAFGRVHHAVKWA